MQCDFEIDRRVIRIGKTPAFLWTSALLGSGVLDIRRQLLIHQDWGDS